MAARDVVRLSALLITPVTFSRRVGCLGELGTMLKQPVRRSLIRGFLIAIEGIDGSGKTTQAGLLRAQLESSGFETVTFKEPTRGQYGEKIRDLGLNGRKYSAEEEFKLFLLDRQEDVEQNIKPALEAGKIVIMDRYYLSSMAYQGARGVSVDKIEKENLKFAPKPDIVILLDISSPTAKGRIQSRNLGKNHFEERLNPVREKFLQIAKTNPFVKIVNGEDTVDRTRSKISEIVMPLIAKYQG